MSKLLDKATWAALAVVGVAAYAGELLAMLLFDIDAAFD